MTPRSPKRLNVALWTAQVLLFLFFVSAGINHAIRPIEAVMKMSPWAGDVPRRLLRFIGIAELSGAVGVLVPALTRILPGVTPLAAAGLGIIMFLAIPFHIMRGEMNVIGLNFIVLLVAAFVAWGRSRKLPIRHEHDLAVGGRPRMTH